MMAYLSGKRVFFLTAIVVSLVGVGLAHALKQHGPKEQVYNPPKLPMLAGAFTLRPAKQDSLGVAPTTSFLLTSREPVSSQALGRGLAFTPPVRFVVESRGSKRFEIRPTKPLMPNRVYRIALNLATEGRKGQAGARSYEWAYQVKTPFRILTTLPRDNAAQVPVNSGIEITFSHDNFEIRELSKHFQIRPSVRGRFEKHKRVLVFVPNGFKHNRIYTVTVKKSFPLVGSAERLARDFAFRFETEGRKRPEEPEGYFEFARTLNEISTTEVPMFEIRASGRLPKGLRVGLYRFRDAEAFLRSLKARDRVPGWAYFARQHFRVDTSVLTKVFSFRPRVEALRIQEEQQVHVIRLPQRVREGYYLLDASLPNSPEQAWLQVSNAAVYLATSETKCLVWVNHLKTKKAIAGASVTLVDGDATSKTNEQGVAFFKTPKRLARYLLVTAPQGEQLVVPVETNLTAWYGYQGDGEGETELEGGNDYYWRYLYTDRILYKPTDTVRFFGFVRHRYKGGSPPQVTLTITREDYRDYYYEPLTIAQQVLPVSDRGFFRGEFKLGNYQTGYYTLTVAHKDFEMRGGFQVETYVKPAYRITVTPEKKSVFAGEPVVYHVKTTFFDGTPVANTQLSYGHESEEESEGEGTITTDARGEARLKVDTSYKGRYSYPMSHTVTVRPRLAEMGEISASASVDVFGPSIEVGVDAQKKAKAQQAMVQVKVRKVDLEKYDREGDYREYRGAPVEGQKLKGRITWNWYAKVAKGFKTEYDFINKKMCKIELCEWVERTELVEQFSGTTDASGRFTYSFSMKPRRWKWVGFSYQTLGPKEVERLRLPGPKGVVTTRVSPNSPAQKAGLKMNDILVQINSAVVTQTEDVQKAIHAAKAGSTLTFQVLRLDKGHWQKLTVHPVLAALAGDPARSYYEVEVEAADAQGRVVWKRVSPSEGYGYDRSEVERPLLCRQNDHEPVSVGESVAFTILRGRKVLPTGGPNSYLFTAAQNGLRRYIVTSRPAYTHRFAEQDVPNLYVSAIWFNGVTYVLCGRYKNLDFEEEDRRLKISVTPDKPRYAPSEEADLTVKVTNKAGKPAMAEVNLCMVDEAFHAVQEQRHAGPLATLYENVDPGILQTYGSHQPPIPEQIGGEEAGGPREYLPDVAYWGFVTTNKEGVGRVRLKLPDNITSWRLTAQAISDRLHAGLDEFTIPVSKPFFVETTYAEEYLTADAPSIKARAFGTALSEGQGAQFVVKAPTLGLEASDPISGKAFLPVHFSLPPLREGSHRLTVAGSSDSLQDALTKPVRVVGSRMERGEAEFDRLAPGLKLKPSASGFTTLVFSDRSRGRFYPALCDLCWVYGERVDQKLARVRALALRKRYFGEKEEGASSEFTALPYQRASGGVSLLPYSGSELPLSAKIAHAASELFDRASLARYFYKVLEDRRTNIESASLALYGLACLQEPVLTLATNGLKSEKLAPMDRLRLALAASRLGAKDVALANLRRVLKEKGETLKPFLRIKVGKDQDDILEATALAAMLAASVGAEEHKALWRYVQENYTEDTLIHLEGLAYLTSVLPRTSLRPVKFTYRIGPRTETKALKKGETFRLALTSEDLRQIQFADIVGDVGVVTLLRRPFRPQEVKQDSNLHLDRTYSAKKQPATTFTEDQIVKVTLTCRFRPQAIGGAYQVTDFLPSGLQILTQPSWAVSGMRDLSHPDSIEGQKVSFLACKGKKPVSFSYLARVVSKGTYEAEPAMLQSLKSADSLRLSQPSVVRIQ